MHCFQVNGYPSEELTAVELRDDGLLKFTCKDGHESVTVIQEQKYELLFDIAVMALLDGYSREAITGMAASLERFYEFAVRIVCAKRGISETAFTTAWKLVAVQSERQFGAFLFASMLESGAPPPTIDAAKPSKVEGAEWSPRQWKEFRNSVVHKGYIPFADEAMAYGELVFDHIQERTKWLTETCPEALGMAGFSKSADAYSKTAVRPISFMSIPTLLSRTREGFANQNFTQAVDVLMQYKRKLHNT